MNPTSIIRSLRSLEHLNQGSRIANLADKLYATWQPHQNISTAKFLILLKFAIVRMNEQHHNFEETQRLWLDFLEVQKFTGFQVKQTKLPFSLSELGQFWEMLSTITVKDKGIEMRGIEYLRSFLELESYQDPTYESIRSYSTNNSTAKAFIDRILDSAAEKKLQRY